MITLELNSQESVLIKESLKDILKSEAFLSQSFKGTAQRILNKIQEQEDDLELTYQVRREEAEEGDRDEE